MGPLGLHDGVQADAGVSQGPADRRGRSRLIGNAADGHLRLIPIEGDTAHLGLAGAGGGGIEVQLAFAQLKAVGCRLEGLVALMAGDQAAHLDFAGGDQTQVDAALGQGVEQARGHTGSTHDSGTGNAELGHPGLGAQGRPSRLGIHGVQDALADRLGVLQLSLRHGEGDVVAAAFVGGLNDQIHAQARTGEGFKQLSGDPRAIGHVGERENGLIGLQLRSIHGLAQLQSFAATPMAGAVAGEQRARGIAPARAHHQRDAVVPSDLDSPGVQDSGAEARQLEHFVAGHRLH